MTPRNIAIIAIGAILAFAAVLAIPQFLNSSGDEDDTEQVASDDGEGESGTSGNDNDDGDSPTETASNDKDTSNAGPGPVQSTGPANPIIASQLQEAARQINAGGPQRIDQYTTMVSASAQGNRIRYRYEISRDLTPQQRQSFRDYATRTNQQTLCQRTETRTLLDMGGEMEYVYFTSGGEYLFSTPITGC